MMLQRIAAKAASTLLLALLAVSPVSALVLDPGLSSNSARALQRLIPGRECSHTESVCSMRATVNFSDGLIGSGVWAFTIPQNAAVIAIDADVTTAFNAGTTNTLSIGATPTGTDFLAATSVSSAGIQHLTSAVGLGLTATGNTALQTQLNGAVPVYFRYQQSGTAATAGAVTVVITYAQITPIEVAQAASAPPPTAAPVNISLPSITGTPQVGQNLNASVGTWSNSPTGFTEQWLANGTAISGATSPTFVPTTAQVGENISVTVIASNAIGSSAGATSATVGPVTAATVAAPTNTVAPTISGSPIVGDTLTATTGTWTGSPTFAEQWLANGTAISGATGLTFVPTSGQVGDNISVEVTASNSGGSTQATSATVGPVTAAATAPVNSVAPVISGTPQVGDTLTASTGTWSGSPTPTFAFSWNGVGSPTNASTYAPVTGDVGNNLIATVTATNSAGSASQPSASVGPVTASGTACAQATTFLARATGETTNAANLTTLICGLVSDGVITGNLSTTGCGTGSFDALYIEAQQTQADAELNLCGTNFTQTLTGAPTFTALTGFGPFNAGGAAGRFISTNFNSQTATSPNFTQNSANFGFWAVSTTVEVISEMGTSTTAAGGSQIFDDFTGGDFFTRVNNSTNSATSPTATKGLFVAERTNSTTIIPYQDGVAQTTQSNTSTTPDSDPFLIGAVVTTTVGSAQTIAEAHVGGALGATLNLALFNRLRTYMTAVGVP